MPIALLGIFLKSLCSSLLKAALRGIGLHTVATLFDVISVFDTLGSISECPDLGVVGLKFGYEMLTDAAAEHIVKDICSDRYAIERTKSGLYVVGSRLLNRSIRIGATESFPPFMTAVTDVKVMRTIVRKTTIS